MYALDRLGWPSKRAKVPLSFVEFLLLLSPPPPPWTTADVAAAVDGAVQALAQSVTAAAAEATRNLDQHCLRQIRDLRQLIASADETIAQEASSHLVSKMITIIDVELYHI